ncbi:MAG: histidine phosphatase family protein [Halanaerobiales bacterium]
MKIGLMRHFKVLHSSKTFMNSAEFEEWIKHYDKADIKTADIPESQVEWEICYSSNLPRAVRTAEAVYKDNIIQREILREVPIAPVVSKSIVLPNKLWLTLGRLAYLFSHKSQPESIDETRERAKRIISEISSLGESNVLVVSHGFLMRFLQKELVKNGFKGEKFTRAENGQLYLFEN